MMRTGDVGALAMSLGGARSWPNVPALSRARAREGRHSRTPEALTGAGPTSSGAVEGEVGMPHEVLVVPMIRSCAPPRVHRLAESGVAQDSAWIAGLRCRVR
jgi:hypothetical protein